jgi:hypothetical protein
MAIFERLMTGPTQWCEIARGQRLVQKLCVGMWPPG